MLKMLKYLNSARNIASLELAARLISCQEVGFIISSKLLLQLII